MFLSWFLIAITFFAVRLSFAPGSLLYILAIITAALATATLAVTLAVVNQPVHASLTIGGVSLLLFIIGGVNLSALIGTFLTALLISLSRKSFRRELLGRIMYRTADVFMPGTRLLATAMLVAAITLGWSAVRSNVTAETLRIAPKTVEPVVQPMLPFLANLIPAPGLLASPVSESLTVNLLAEQVAGLLNQMIQSTLSYWPWIVTVIVILVAVVAIRSIVPLVAWPLVGVIALTVYMYRRIGLIFLTRTQGTIERLQL